MIRFRFVPRLMAAGALLLLAGCASREPLDYLPEGTTYVAVNMSEVRKDAGTKRLMDVLQKLDQSAVKADSKAERMYFSVAGVPPQAGVYGVMIGQDGFAEQSLSDLKAAGGSEAKLSGRKAVMGEKFGLSPLNDRAVLFFGNAAELEQMIATAKRKSPGAAQTALFRQTQELANSHGVAMTLNTAPLLAMAGPQLGVLSMMNAKGVEALKQSEALAVTLDWDEKPTVQATLTGPSEGREDLAALLNTLLAQVKQRLPKPGAGQDGSEITVWAGLLQKLQAKPGTGGVELTLEFPKTESDALLSRMESTAETLPKDPAQRAKALREAFSGGAGPQAP